LAFAQHNCNIEVALIDTEGEMAIDVFYLTANGKKLDDPTERELTNSLQQALKALR
jgi:[protein-PII] uridylyltransferase